jgi:hypothetical protein
MRKNNVTWPRALIELLIVAAEFCSRSRQASGWKAARTAPKKRCFCAQCGPKSRTS